MIYKTQDEKEVFKNLLPEINQIKNTFKKHNLKGFEVERNIIDCINNEIYHISQPNNKYHKRLANGNYRMYLREIKNEDIRNEVDDIIQDIINKLDKLEKEYFEKV